MHTLTYNSTESSDMTLNSSNGNRFNQSDGCRPFQYPMAFGVYGVVCPIIFAVTVCTNLLVIAVFTKKKMRSPTTILLIGLAISDTLSGGVISYTYIYIYGLGHDNEPMDYPMCIIYDYSSHFSSLFHTASIWITTCLGIQRYIIIAHPFIGPRFCTIKISIWSMFFIYLGAIAMYLPRFMYVRYESVPIIDSNGLHREICMCPDNPDISDYYEAIVNILRCALGQLTPCGLLIVTTILLVRILRFESNRILQLHEHEENEGERKDFRHIRRTSQMIIMIVVTFIFVELPNGLVFAIVFVDRDLIPLNFQLYLSVILNMMVYISFLINFWIYVCLSEQFRKTLSSILRFRLCTYTDRIDTDASCKQKLNCTPESKTNASCKRKLNSTQENKRYASCKQKLNCTPDSRTKRS